MSSIINLLFYLKNHPIGRINIYQTLVRLIRWQIVSRLSPWPLILPFIGPTRFIATRGLTGITGNVYVGLQDFELMGFLLHFLRPTDLFVDVGANVGGYTILASGVVGASSVCFEPMPETFQILTQNVALNHISSLVKLHNQAVGNDSGFVRFGTKASSASRILSEVNTSQATIYTPAVRLDDVQWPQVPALVKIDVEGFESFVLDGANKLMQNGSVIAAIVEINGLCRHFGFSNDDIHRKMSGLGWQAATYSPITRELTPIPGPDKSGDSTLYVRDMTLVRERTNNAKSFTVYGHTF